jgi:hypothetical protein
MDWVLDLLALLGTSSNYSATSDLHTLQLITTPAKPFPTCFVFNGRPLVTASNSGNSAVTRAQDLVTTARIEILSIPSISVTRLPLFITFLYESHRKHFSIFIAR